MMRLAMMSLPFVAASLGAQDFHGVARDSANTPVSDVMLSLFDRSKQLVGTGHSDEKGVFLLRVPRAGSYTISAVRIGFRPWNSLPLEVEGDESISLEPILTRLPVTLSAVVVRAQRDSIIALKLYGLDIRALGGSLVTPAEIEPHIPSSTSLLDIVRSVAPTWVSVKNYPGSGCASTRNGACLLVYIDGARTASPDVGQLIAPEWIDHIVFVRPAEASTMFGYAARAGVMLVYTRAERRARAPGK